MFNPIKKQVIAKLIAGRGELDDALQLSAPAARYDAVVLPEVKRNQVLLMVHGLEQLIREIEEHSEASHGKACQEKTHQF